MTNYTYTRELSPSGHYNIENIDRVDELGFQIYLAQEIQSALPGKIFKVKSSHDECVVYFEEALTAAEKTTLDQVVSDHKNNA